MTVEESRLRFTFQDDKWWLVKFDEDINYTKVTNSLQGVKGVDFIGILNSESLFFFELKNFRNHTMTPHTQERLANGAEDLTTEIAQKVKDSVACVVGASRNATHDNDKWTLASKIITTQKPFKIIAWIEEDLPDSEIKRKNRKAKLSTRNEKLKNKLNWLTSSVFMANIKEGRLDIEGLSIEYK